jgi:flagellar motor switch protein FliG
MRCLRNPHYEKSKAESMLDAGEELKTRMVVEGLERSGTDGSNAILDGLARLTPSQLVDLSMKINIRLVPRFFSYLSSTKMAEIMNAVNAEDPNRLELLLPKLLLIPKYQTSTEFDSELEEEIGKCLADQSGNEYKPLLKRYVELIENSADEIAESIYETLATEPVVAKFLRTNVVLFTTLFKLKSEIQSEVINTLSVKETATLLHHLAEPERNLILATIYGRNLELIQEELSLQEGQGKSSKTERLFKDVKIKIVKTLRAYKTAGNLEFSDGKDQLGTGSVQKTMDNVA